MESHKATEAKAGDLVRDLRRDRNGVVMDTWGGRLYLRPLTGGREWSAPPQKVRRLTAREELSARLAVRNALARRYP
ncbi:MULTISPECIES: hypothetical protein [Streptomyces]|uniref:Integrase n=1 Tax=Streptomyces sudanensis TaxID=436397 RepID=A0ABY4TIB1_9ACTN|nr:MULTISPECIES: hypothetical protein [Streptomyces]MCP9985866.1 hypothetical protein [Streptomyces sudanensis]URN17498.1 hypothetical protein MW084_17925 [Streptomyces sudanensis]